MAVRGPDANDRRMWRTARLLSGIARVAWWAKETFWAVASVAASGGGDRGQSDRSEVMRTSPTPDVCPATLLPPAGCGPPRDRLRVRWPRVRGSLSLPDDGLLWQPDESGGRGLLMKNSEVENLIVGLSAHGVIVQLRDGRLGFMLDSGTGTEFAGRLAARFAADP